jgi:hypothetical protein
MRVRTLRVALAGALALGWTLLTALATLAGDGTIPIPK